MRRLRQERKLTMEQLTKAVGVSKSYIWALENNPEQRTQRTSATVMNNLVKALGITLQDLLGETPFEALGGEANPEDVIFFTELHEDGCRGSRNLSADAGVFQEAERQVIWKVRHCAK
nr:helix-turn-helix transcriptional regulator [Ferrovum sp.]